LTNVKVCVKASVVQGVFVAFHQAIAQLVQVHVQLQVAAKLGSFTTQVVQSIHNVVDVER
jgi:hypothetical protein